MTAQVSTPTGIHLKVPLYFRSSSKYYSFNWHMCHLKVPDNEYSSNTTDMRIWVYVDWILSIMKKQNYRLNSFVGNCEPVTASWSWFWSRDREENGSWHGAIVGLMNHSYRVVLPEKRDPRPYAGSRIWRYMYTFIYLYTLYPERRYSVEH